MQNAAKHFKGALQAAVPFGLKNTFGKPVGPSGFDLPACDGRLRVVTLKLENADGNGDYFKGLGATQGLARELLQPERPSSVLEHEAPGVY